MNISDTMNNIGQQARIASRVLGRATNDQKTLALTASAEQLLMNAPDIISANAKDIENAAAKGLSESLIDRLRLDESRIASMATGLRTISELTDPVGEVIADWDRPNGLRIQRVRTPLGVIGVIYESRPNVTADAGALCLKSGNAVILRGGSDSFHSSNAIHACLVHGLRNAELPESAIQIVPTVDRAAVGEMLCGLNGSLDVIVPRGGKSLVARVQNESRVPVFAHLEGICHVYVDGDANLEMAVSIVLNAKMRRTGICGAAETLLIDSKCVESHASAILSALVDAGCEVRGDDLVRDQFPSAHLATEDDWSMEYLAPIISVKVVGGVADAIAHIEKYSSGHTEAIVTDNIATAEKFLGEIDSAILLHNASTQFADGGEFGMGAEIGIATGKMHARGPVGVEQLTSFNYRVRGTGQTRS